jgi:hypothetical protein
MTADHLENRLQSASVQLPRRKDFIKSEAESIIKNWGNCIQYGNFKNLELWLTLSAVAAASMSFADTALVGYYAHAPFTEAARSEFILHATEGAVTGLALGLQRSVKYFDPRKISTYLRTPLYAYAGASICTGLDLVGRIIR